MKTGETVMFSNLSLGDTLLVTVTGMLIVFFVLLILIAVISMFGKVASGKGGRNKNEKIKPDKTSPKMVVRADEKSSGTALDTTDRAISMARTTASDDEIIAVIAAAVAVYTEKTGGAAPVIRSIRDEKGRPIWATAGLIRNTRAF